MRYENPKHGTCTCRVAEEFLESRGKQMMKYSLQQPTPHSYYHLCTTRYAPYQLHAQVPFCAPRWQGKGSYQLSHGNGRDNQGYMFTFPKLRENGQHPHKCIDFPLHVFRDTQHQIKIAQP